MYLIIRTKLYRLKIIYLQSSAEKNFNVKIREEVNMAEIKIGEVVKFFSKPLVAAIKITDSDLSVGDRIKFTGHTTDFIDEIKSMEVDNKAVPKAVAGDFIGVKVSDRVRPGDEVFKVTAD
jgi:putative protease